MRWIRNAAGVNISLYEQASLRKWTENACSRSLPFAMPRVAPAPLFRSVDVVKSHLELGWLVSDLSNSPHQRSRRLQNLVCQK